MQASGRTVEAVEQFLYFGSAINSDGNISSDWYGLWRHGQIVQCVAAIQTQPGNQVESLQLTCPVCSPERM